MSLESSAYERLKAARAPGESFSETINRILAGSRTSIRSLAGFLSPSDCNRVKTAIRRMRAQEAPAERGRTAQWRKTDGRNVRNKRAH
ncbi:MAG: antitoxin VapB family protein [Thermoplasmata archaeon]